VKHGAFRTRVASIEARIGVKGAKITITGGLPPDYKPAEPKPGGADLHEQARAFRQAAGASETSKPASEASPDPKSRQRAS
jgi:hypothetical protein